MAIPAECHPLSDLSLEIRDLKRRYLPSRRQRTTECGVDSTLFFRKAKAKECRAIFGIANNVADFMRFNYPLFAAMTRKRVLHRGQAKAYCKIRLYILTVWFQNSEAQLSRYVQKMKFHCML